MIGMAGCACLNLQCLVQRGDEDPWRNDPVSGEQQGEAINGVLRGSSQFKVPTAVSNSDLYSNVEAGGSERNVP